MPEKKDKNIMSNKNNGSLLIFPELLRQKFYYIFTSPLFYIISIFENLLCFAYYFSEGNFFSGTQSYPLLSLFAVIPLISSVCIPVFSLYLSEDFDEYLPVSKTTFFIFKSFCETLLYTVSLLPLFLVTFSTGLFTSVDFAAFLTSFLFIIVYALLCSSICIFFEALISRKITRFFTSFSVLLINFFASSVIQNISESPLKKLLQLFSFSCHFNSASKGIFDSRDFIFFITASFVFVFIAVLILNKKRGKQSSGKEKIKNILISIITLLVFLNSSRYYFRLDLTKEKNYSLSKYTKNLISECEDNIEITYYRTKGVETYYPSSREIPDFLYEYNSFSNIKFEVKDAALSQNQQVLKRNGLEPKSIERRVNGKTEYIDIYSAVFVEYQGDTKIIPFTLTSKNLEYLIDEKIADMNRIKKRTLLIVPSYSECSEGAYEYLETFLSSVGFIPYIYNSGDVADWIINHKKYSDLMLVLGSEDLNSKAVEEIETFLEEGSSCFFAVSPYKKDAAVSWSVEKISNRKLLQLLETYGFRFSSEILSDISSSRILMEDDSGYSKLLNYTQWPSILPQEGVKNGMTLFWPCALELPPEKTEPLIFTSEYTWREEKRGNEAQEPGKTGHFKSGEGTAERTADSVAFSLFETNPFELENRKIPEKTSMKKECVAARHSGEGYGYYNPGVFPDIRFTVLSDQNFLDSLLLGYISTSGADFRNLDFLVKELLYLNGEKELSKMYENSIDYFSLFHKIPDEETFIKTKKAVLILHFIVFPVVMLGIFTFMMILRKRRKYTA